MKNQFLFSSLLLSLFALTFFAFCKRQDPEIGDAANREREDILMKEFIAKKGFVMTKDINGFYYGIIKQNTPILPVKQGDTVAVHYDGTLLNDKRFDSSILRGEPFTFVPGSNRVITGWELAILKLGVKDKMRFVFPSYLGYGSKGSLPSIPANAPLYFEIEVMSVKRK